MSSTRHPAVEKIEDSRFGKAVRGKCNLEIYFLFFKKRERVELTANTLHICYVSRNAKTSSNLKWRKYFLDNAL